MSAKTAKADTCADAANSHFVRDSVIRVGCSERPQWRTFELSSISLKTTLVEGLRSRFRKIPSLQSLAKNSPNRH